MKKHLITGITGQDGIFLTKKILQENKSVNVIGISRYKDSKDFFKKLSLLKTDNLERVKILNTDLKSPDEVQVLLETINPEDMSKLVTALRSVGQEDAAKALSEEILCAHLLSRFAEGHVDGKAS